MYTPSSNFSLSSANYTPLTNFVIEGFYTPITNFTVPVEYAATTNFVVQRGAYTPSGNFSVIEVFYKPTTNFNVDVLSGVDGVKLSEYVSSVYNGYISLSDGAILSENAVANLVPGIVSDGVKLSESVFISHNIPINISDGITMSDSGYIVGDPNITILDGIKIAESVGTVATLNSSVIDGASLSECYRSRVSGAGSSALILAQQLQGYAHPASSGDGKLLLLNGHEFRYRDPYGNGTLSWLILQNTIDPLTDSGVNAPIYLDFSWISDDSRMCAVCIKEQPSEDYYLVRYLRIGNSPTTWTWSYQSKTNISSLNPNSTTTWAISEDGLYLAVKTLNSSVYGIDIYKWNSNNYVFSYSISPGFTVGEISIRNNALVIINTDFNNPCDLTDNIGRAHLFENVSDTWTEVATFFDKSQSGLTNFGVYIAFKGNHLVALEIQISSSGRKSSTGFFVIEYDPVYKKFKRSNFVTEYNAKTYSFSTFDISVDASYIFFYERTFPNFIQIFSGSNPRPSVSDSAIISEKLLVQSNDWITENIRFGEALAFIISAITSDGVKLSESSSALKVLNLLASDSALLAEIVTAKQINAVADIIKLSDQALSTQNIIATFSDIVLFLEQANVSIIDLVSDSLVLSESIVTLCNLAQDVSDALISSDSVSTQNTQYEQLNELINLIESLSSIFSKFVSDGLNLSEALTSLYTAKISILESFNIAETPSNIITLGVLISETANIRESLLTKADLFSVLSDGFILKEGGDGGATYLGYVLNTENFALTQWQNFNFNSLCNFNNELLMASDTGLYKLGGTTDDGTTINAQIETAAFNFNDMMAIPKVYIGASMDGSVVLRVRVGGKEKADYLLTDNGVDVNTQRIKLGRGLRGRSWQFELITQSNSQLDMDSIEFNPVAIKRKI